MRKVTLLLTLPMMFAAAACSEQTNSSLQNDANTAADSVGNAASDAGDTISNAADDVGNRAEKVGDAIENAVD